MNDELQKLRIDKEHKVRREPSPLWKWVFLALLAVGGLLGFSMWRKTAAAVTVQTIRVRPAAEATTGPGDSDLVVLNATGYIVAAHRIELASKVVGRVAWVGVEMGDKITKGQVLVRLEDDEFKVRVAQQQGLLENAQAKLAELEAGSRPEEIGEAKAMLDASKAQLANAQSNLDRLKKLDQDRNVSRQEIDDAETLLRSRQAQVDAQQHRVDLVVAGPRKEQIAAAKATVHQLEGSLAQAQLDLDNTIIRAPMDATVLSRNVEVGEFVTTGFVGDRGAKGYVLSIADLNDLRVDLDIDQNSFAKVQSHQSCWITTDAYPDRRYDGTVDLISPEANRQKATIQVRVKVLHPDELLKPDMNATVYFRSVGKASATQEKPLIRVPKAALREGGAVFVVADGRAVRRSITIGQSSATGEVQVRQGLVGGEDLIVDAPSTLQNGDRVSIREHGN